MGKSRPKPKPSAASGANQDAGGGRWLSRLAGELFADQPDERSAFVAAMTEPRQYAPAVCWMRPRPSDAAMPCLPRLAWQPPMIDRLAPGQRPGQTDLHAEGAFYCLDPSSVFCASVLSAIDQPVARMIDLCAAPGGKAIVGWSVLRPAELIANEVIGKRLGSLISNLQRCRLTGTLVTSVDPSRIAMAWPQTADVVLVDAPCSGQSLSVRGKPVAGAFHPATINLNANRQRRILAAAVPMLAPGGYLAYMTCTFSLKENERNVAWLLEQQPTLESVEVPDLAPYRSSHSDHFTYRLWPQSGVGSGGFTALLRSTADHQPGLERSPAINPVWGSADTGWQPAPQRHPDRGGSRRSSGEGQSAKRRRRV
jgi:16S rRNA C967 or C1407 C5-methylase (RsmB/RsmF family)